MEMEMEMTKKSYTLFSVLTVFRIMAAQLSLKWVIRPNFRCIIPPPPLYNETLPFPPLCDDNWLWSGSSGLMHRNCGKLINKKKILKTLYNREMSFST